jgi:hypothetical protein
MATIRIPGELEIDAERGVIYFHTSSKKFVELIGSVTVLRICGIPKPVVPGAIDITLAENKVFKMRTWRVDVT